MGERHCPNEECSYVTSNPHIKKCRKCDTKLPSAKVPKKERGHGRHNRVR